VSVTYKVLNSYIHRIQLLKFGKTQLQLSYTTNISFSILPYHRSHKYDDKKRKAAVVHTNITATSVGATAVTNTAYGAGAAGDAAAAVRDTADNAAAAGSAAA
jgi:hypothetical protein